jgi:hypothetical protein
LRLKASGRRHQALRLVRVGADSKKSLEPVLEVQACGGLPEVESVQPAPRLADLDDGGWIPRSPWLLFWRRGEGCEGDHGEEQDKHGLSGHRALLVFQRLILPANLWVSKDETGSRGSGLELRNQEILGELLGGLKDRSLGIDDTGRPVGDQVSRATGVRPLTVKTGVRSHE